VRSLLRKQILHDVGFCPASVVPGAFTTKKNVHMNRPILAIRTNSQNPNHHIYRNNGTFWAHLTVHLPDFTKRRYRLSLKTHDVEEARLRRDNLIGDLDSVVTTVAKEVQ
jgi:hypothetical protein